MKNKVETITDMSADIAYLKSRLATATDEDTKNKLSKQIESLEDALVIYKITTDHGIRNVKTTV